MNNSSSASRHTLGGVSIPIRNSTRLNFQVLPSPLRSRFRRLRLCHGLREQSRVDRGGTGPGIHLDRAKSPAWGRASTCCEPCSKNANERYLAKYETDTVAVKASNRFNSMSKGVTPPNKLKSDYASAIKHEQIFFTRAIVVPSRQRSKSLRAPIDASHRRARGQVSNRRDDFEVPVHRK